MRANFIRSLASVLAGAAIYWALMPRLPRAWQHQLYQVDLGLFMYAMISLVIFGIISYLGGRS